MLQGLQDAGAAPSSLCHLLSSVRQFNLELLRAQEVGTSEVTLALHNSAPKKSSFQEETAVTGPIPLCSESGADEENGSRQCILLMLFSLSHRVEMACVLGVVLGICK